MKKKKYIPILIVGILVIAHIYMAIDMFTPYYDLTTDLDQRERAYLDTFRIDKAGITVVTQNTKSKLRIFFGNSDFGYCDYFDYIGKSEPYQINIHFIPPDSIYIIDRHNEVARFAKWRYKMHRIVAGDSILGYYKKDNDILAALLFLSDSTSFYRPHYTIGITDSKMNPIQVWCSYNDSLIYDSDTVKLNTVKGYYYIHHNKTVLDSI